MNIYNLINRANLLQEETTIDSISPSRIGSLIKEILLYINEYQLLASSPEIQKIYLTVSAMQSDGKPVSDLTGRSLNPGQLVVIVPESQTDATAGDVYRYDGPSGNTSAWTFVAKIGAVPADSELNSSSTNPVQNKVVTEKLTELSGEYQELAEYIKVYTDGNGRFLWGIKTDGSIEFEKGVPKPIRSYINSIAGSIDDKIEAINEFLENLDFFKKEENPEYTQVILDADDRVVSYRDLNCVLHEHSLQVEEFYYKGEKLEKLLENNIKTQKDFIYCERPKFAEIYFYGKLPTDTSDERIPTNMTFNFVSDGKLRFKSNCKMSIQGQGSVNAIKHNWTLDIVDENGNEQAVKFGNMPALDSYHLKGYYSDRTHSRGVGGAAIWRNMVNLLGYPYGKVNNKPFNISDEQNIDSIYNADARYREDGFPVAMYLNDEFYGLYTIKTKKHRKNYAMQKSVKNEIFIDSVTYEARLDKTFDHRDWEVKNPKIKNYDEGQVITDADVLANIERVFEFLNNITSQSHDHADFIVLPHWLVYYIFSEVIGNVDINGNNMNLLTWDGIHWSIIPYDLDITLGLHTWDDHHIDATQEGRVLSSITFFNNFYNAYKDDIIEMYKHYRESGFLTEDNLYSYYMQQVESIPRDVYEMDFAKWEDNWSNGIPTMEQIYSYLHSRIEYLDSIWMNK